MGGCGPIVGYSAQHTRGVEMAGAEHRGALLRRLLSQHGLSVQVIDEISAALLTPVVRNVTSAASIETVPFPGRDIDHAPADNDALLGNLGDLGRYEDLGLLGEGSMGEVRRVRDRLLGCTLAMKIIKARYLRQSGLVTRFLEEAQTTAQLQHPGIVPVHDMGRRADGRLWFTMKEVTGQTLGALIKEVHTVSGHQWQTSSSGWTLHRLMDVFLRVCEAVAYAHGRGVVHRDLKPENIMVGLRGEVLVLDWGLGKLVGDSDRVVTDEGERQEPIQTVRSRTVGHATRNGAIAGTPAYMSPEQAQGEVERISSRSDVFSLGVVLYEILFGRAPYQGESIEEVLQKVISGSPNSLGLDWQSTESGERYLSNLSASALCDGRPMPRELLAICAKAMANEPAERFASAAGLSVALAAWRDGLQRTARARAVVVAARERYPEAVALRLKAGVLREEAQAMLKPIAPWRPEADKLSAWAKEDAAHESESQASLLELEALELLQASLTHDADLPEAHAALANRYRADHIAAESNREDASQPEYLLRQHAAALPEDHPDRSDHIAYLKGDGVLSLETDPSGAEVLLYRYECSHRRLVLRFERSLGRTPLHAVRLPRGSYLCILRYPGRIDVHYPISIERLQHWDGVPPGGSKAAPIPLPYRSALSPEDCYVPAGWFLSGGSEVSLSLPARRLWVEGMVFRRFPVTNTEFITFLEDLVAQGRRDEAMQFVPRTHAPAGRQGAAIYGFDGKRFSLIPDTEGDVWGRDWPVMMVDWLAARAYAAWEADRTGRRWRLPGELEWEKGARGVDGRRYPWGEGFDPSWACMRSSHEGNPLPCSVERFAVDESPYGIRGMGGNMSDWCADVYRETGPSVSAQGRAYPEGMETWHGSEDALVVRRGGSWDSAPARLILANRNGDKPLFKSFFLGFRLVRSIS